MYLQLKNSSKQKKTNRRKSTLPLKVESMLGSGCNVLILKENTVSLNKFIILAYSKCNNNNMLLNLRGERQMIYNSWIHGRLVYIIYVYGFWSNTKISKGECLHK